MLANNTTNTTSKKLTIYNIDETIHQYTPLSTIIQWKVDYLSDELYIHNINTITKRELYISTHIHIYNVYETDEVYGMSVQMKHTSDIHQNHNQWVKIYIHRYSHTAYYTIEGSGYRYDDGERMQLKWNVPLDVIEDRNKFVEILHRICIELSRETIDMSHYIRHTTHPPTHQQAL
jgi:hypothetical protein